MTETKNLEPRPPEDWPEELGHLKNSFAERLNVYRTMAHHPRLLASWPALRQHIVLDNALGAERLEIVILRIASRLGSRYEWAHHVERSKSLGLTPARIQSIGGPAEGMSPDDALLTRAVDALIDDTKLQPDLLSELTKAVGTEGVFDAMATVGFYKTLGCIVETFGVLTDDLEDTDG